MEVERNALDGDERRVASRSTCRKLPTCLPNRLRGAFGLRGSPS